MSAEVVAAVAEAHRRDWAKVLAATARMTRDLDLAEECTQEAQLGAQKRHRGSGCRYRTTTPVDGQATVGETRPAYLRDSHAGQLKAFLHAQ